MGYGLIKVCIRNGKYTNILGGTVTDDFSTKRKILDYDCGTRRYLQILKLYKTGHIKPIGLILDIFKRRLYIGVPIIVFVPCGYNEYNIYFNEKLLLFVSRNNADFSTNVFVYSKGHKFFYRNCDDAVRIYEGFNKHYLFYRFWLPIKAFFGFMGKPVK